MTDDLALISVEDAIRHCSGLRQAPCSRKDSYREKRPSAERARGWACDFG